MGKEVSVSLCLFQFHSSQFSGFYMKNQQLIAKKRAFLTRLKPMISTFAAFDEA